MTHRLTSTRERDPAELAGCLQMAEILARRYGKDRGPEWRELREDLVREAQLVVLQAWNSFDPRRGLRFSTYAYPSVQKQLKRRAWALQGKVPAISLDTATGPDGETPLYELIPDERVDVASEALTRAGGQMAPLLASLKPKERHIIQRHFYEGWTLAQIGEELGVTREAVRMAEKRALKQLRGSMTLDQHREGAAQC